MNLQDREVELNWREVTCKRSVQRESFARGIQDFDFSVSGKNAFIPSLSYFVIDATLTMRVRDTPLVIDGVKNGASAVIAGGIFRRPQYSDAIAFADHFGSCLYNNAFFRAGNSDVSLITQYIPQAGVLKSRLDKSFAWSKSIGRIVMHDDADFDRRRKYVSIDGKFHDDGLDNPLYEVIPSLNLSGTTPTGTVTSRLAWDDASSIGIYLQTGTNAGFDADLRVTGLAVGDILGSGVYRWKIQSLWYPDANTTRFLGVPIDNSASVSLVDGPAIVFVVKCRDAACGFNSSQIMFQPPLGIFSEANPMSGGDFKISLNPSPNYKRSSVQSLSSLVPLEDGIPNASADYDLVINDVKFYVCTIKSDVSPSGVIPLSLIEMSVLNKTLNNVLGTQNLDFTVPPSTLALTVFVQSGDVGSITYLPPTKFYTNKLELEGDNNAVTVLPSALYNNTANRLSALQVTYGSITKTQTQYTSNLNTTAGINDNIQRFLQSIQYSGKITSDGGSESHPQYLERGNYWHFDFSKDKNDTSSYVNVQIGFSVAVPPSTQLFLVAHYSRQCEISYENGFITQVVSVNR